MPSAVVKSVDQVTTKDGAPAWQIVTDYAERGPDGKVSSAFWLPRLSPVPAVGQKVSWGSSWFRGWAEWDGERYPRLGLSFDPNDSSLWTG